METILITGAGSGLGRELAHIYSNNGYRLVLIGRSINKLQQVKAEIESTNGIAEIFQLDIRSSESILQQIEDICSNYTLTGLINNAGTGFFGPFSSMSELEIKEIIETNVLGTINITKAVLPYFEKRNKGHIMNIISTAGLRGKVNESVYVASKFAIRGFTESLQKEYENSGIRFTGVYMGGMDTPFWENSDHIKDPSRLRSPKEIAEIIYANKDKEMVVIEK